MSTDACSYADIAGTLGREIGDGIYSAAGALPSLTSIMRRFGVSRLTAVRAVDELKKRGIIATQKGKGMFLTRRARTLGGALGFLVPGICYIDIFPAICRRLSLMAQKRGVNLIFGEIDSDDPESRAEQALSLARKLAAEKVLGVFFEPIELVREYESINHEILSIFDAAKIPVVLIDADIVFAPARSTYDLVGVNGFESGRRIATHLVESGARTIGLVSGKYSHYSVQNRYAGVKSVVMSAGGRIVPLFIDTSDEKAVRKALAKRPRLDAIICRNDHQAAHLLVTLRRLGVSVPGDLMVAGCNDSEYSEMLEPSLTTLHFPCDDVARLAFSTLWSRIENPALPPRECYLHQPLVVRDSTTGERTISKGNVKTRKRKAS